jgi:hypothetical protein
MPIDPDTHISPGPGKQHREDMERAQRNLPRRDREPASPQRGQPNPAGGLSAKMLREVTNRLPLSAEMNNFVDWMNRQGIDAGATGAIGPKSLFMFIIGWCKSRQHGLTSFVTLQFAGTFEESIAQAIRSLEPYQSSPSVSGYPYVTTATEMVLLEAQALVASLKREEIEVHHVFASLLIAASKSSASDGFLGLSQGRVVALSKTLLLHFKEKGYGEAWDYWNRAFQVPSSDEADEKIESVTESPPPPRKLKEEELTELRQFFGDEKIKLSYAVTDAITNASEACAGFAEAEGTCIVGSGILFLGFLEVVARDRGKEWESRSLPVALVRDLDFGTSKLNSGKARYFKIQEGFDNDGGETGLVWGRTFWEIFTTALEIQKKCSPPKEKDDKWVSARHLVAALLKLDAEGGTSSKELQNVGFEPHLVAKTLREHLTNYSSRDSAPEWEKFFNGLPEAARPQKTSTPETGRRLNAGREAKREELCLDIEAYSRAIADTFSAAAEEDDFVFALYAPWGRGKSTLIKEVARILGGDEEIEVIFGKDSSSVNLPAEDESSKVISSGEAAQPKKKQSEPGRGYKPIFFSAWKYPTRPEVWVHLYQKVAAAAQEGGLLQKYRIGFRMGLLQHGWLPLIGGLSLLAVSRLYFEATNWLLDGLGVMGLVIIGSFLWNAGKFGKHVAHTYLATPDHAEKLGLQAVIGRDLKDLLSVWTNPKNLSATGRPSVNRLRAIAFSEWSKARACLLLCVGLAWLTVGLVFWKLYHHLDSVERAKSLSSVSSTNAPSVKMEVNLEWKDSKLHWAGTPEISGSDKENERGSNWSKLVVFEGILGFLGFGISFLMLALARAPKQHDRVFLVVDDLDRCEPDQMTAVIESLRLFLDEPEMSRRLQVAMLLDRTIFGRALIEKGLRCHALRAKATGPEHNKFFREQEEKLFVATLELPQLDHDGVKDVFKAIVRREVQHQHHEQRRQVDADIERQRGNISRPVGMDDMAGAEQSASDDKELDADRETRRAEVDAKEKAELDRLRVVREATQEKVNAKSDPDIAFTDDEIALLQQVVSKLPADELTPRALRAFVLRYQLVRLILKQLGRWPGASLVLNGLVDRFFPGALHLREPVPPTVRAAVDLVAGRDGDVFQVEQDVEK